MWFESLPHQETGRPFCGLITARHNYSVSCPGSSFRRSVRKTMKFTSLIGRGCSAHSYCMISTSWTHAAMKKLIVVCYCMYHTLHSMVTIRCLFALLTLILFCLAVFAISQLPAGCELWQFATSKSFRYLAAPPIAANLGPDMSCALQVVHALTRCDAVYKHGDHIARRILIY